MSTTKIVTSIYRGHVRTLQKYVKTYYPHIKDVEKVYILVKGVDHSYMAERSVLVSIELAQGK